MAPTKSSMHIRPLTRTDIPSATTIGSSAFLHDPFHDIIAPGRHSNPLTYRAFTASRIQKRFHRPSHWGYVCIDNDPASGVERVIGYAFWERQLVDAKVEDAWIKPTDWWSAFNAKLLQWQIDYDRYVACNRAISYSGLDALLRHYSDEGNDVLAPLNKTTHWSLGVLAVHPDHHRRGVGSLLVKQGLALAEEETKSSGLQVPVALVATDDGFKLYKKLGFRTVARARVNLDDGRSLDGGCAMVWDPSDTWVTDASEEVRAQNNDIEAVWTEKALKSSDS